MRPRVVDWALLLLVAAEVGSGLGSFLVGRPTGRWVFWLHGALGLALVALVGLKLARVRRRVLERARWEAATPVSVALALAALGTAGLGVIWVLAQWPVNYPNGMILHTSAGILLLVLCLWHLALRAKPLRRVDLADRRSLLGLLALGAGGGLAWGAVELANRLAELPGKRRRFTGSRLAGAAPGRPFPVTMWFSDQVPALDARDYRLAVGGAVQTRLRLSLAELLERRQRTLDATLDCTGGWYTTQEWTGVPVGDLLAQAGAAPTAQAVRFLSATGYRWSLPLAEAQAALLATHVGGRPLDAGHGAPLRLVAPGRRGFQWVKWVVAVEVLEAPDVGQWAAIFTSGLDGA
jgi:DMSO/TMAO reductase YedYZ molybdopterin-dependent catalytic subunit